MRYLDVRHVQFSAVVLAKLLYEQHTEPISSTFNFGRLDSALQRPKQTFNGLDLYPTLTDKATVLLYSMVMNHPFENGNKRIASVTMLMFLFLNRFWVNHGQRDLYILTSNVAVSNDQKKMEEEIRQWLNKRIFQMSANATREDQIAFWRGVQDKT